MSQTKSGPDAIESRFSEVDGIKIHYLTAGHGPAVIRLHGYTQTSRMWKPLIPKLADKFTVVAPDLPGIGDSDIPKDGLDMKTQPFASMLSRNPSASAKRGSSGMTSVSWWRTPMQRSSQAKSKSWS